MVVNLQEERENNVNVVVLWQQLTKIHKVHGDKTRTIIHLTTFWSWVNIFSDEPDDSENGTKHQAFTKEIPFQLLFSKQVIFPSISAQIGVPNTTETF
jgi:hypothetical protein